MDNLFENKLIVGPSPHVGTTDSIPRIMWTVVIALLPAFVVSVANFGWYAVLITAISILSAVITEAAVQKFRNIPITISDGSAVVTGLLLAFTIPPNVPLYLPIIGSVFAIAIAKHAFGGLGCNIWNPALAGRAFLLAAYSGNIVMTKWPILGQVFTGNVAVEAVTRATPLAVLKHNPLLFFQDYSIFQLFIGRVAGSIGEMSALALIAGGIFLIIRGYVNWRMPFSFIVAVFVLTILLPVSNGHHGESILLWQHLDTLHFSGILSIGLAQILSGGLMLGAFFMATDMVTSPLSNKGQAIFGLGCGILTALIRLYGGYPEGVCYSILIMNTAVWVIDKYTVPRFFGASKHVKKAA